MAQTYTPIATTTLASPAASYTFSSIPSTYTDLVLVAQAANSIGDGYYFGLQFNGDTATNYSDTSIYGTGSSALSTREASVTRIIAGWTSLSAPTTLVCNIQNYSNTTTYKTALMRNANSAYREGAWVGLWRSTAAINSITVTSESTSSFLTGSTLTLYGIKAA